MAAVGHEWPLLVLQVEGLLLLNGVVEPFLLVESVLSSVERGSQVHRLVQTSLYVILSITQK